MKNDKRECDEIKIREGGHDGLKGKGSFFEGGYMLSTNEEIRS